MKIIKAIYNFIVGDMIILIGVIATAILLGLINLVGGLVYLRAIEGLLLIVAVVGVLTATLLREARGKR